MPEVITVPIEEYKKVVEAYKSLEDEKLKNMDPETRAQYFQTRALVAEDELTKTTLKQATAELKEKYPAADVTEVTGKTVSELEAAFKASETRNKAAYERAKEAVLKELDDKVKEADQTVQDKVGEIFKAWGHPRVPSAEDTKILNDETARKALKQETGIDVSGEATAPTTIDDIIMSKLPAVGSRLFAGKK